MKHLLFIFSLLLASVSWSKDVDWNDLAKNNKLDSLSLPSLKEYLSKNNINVYGKKSELIDRIKDNLNQS